MKNLSRALALLMLLGGLFISTPGCMRYVEPEEEISTDYYQPMYYQGRVVYYTNDGHPTYYVGGQLHYVPRTYVHYNTYRGYYRTHHVHYRRWNRTRGYRYRRVYYRPRYHGYVRHKRIRRHRRRYRRRVRRRHR